MKKTLIIGLAAAATIAGAASLVKVEGSTQAPAAVVTEVAAAEREEPPAVIRMAQLVANQPYMLDYERGPRIIHVPQSGERGKERSQDRPNDRVASRAAARASVERRSAPAASDADDDDEYVAPQPRLHVVTPKPRVAAPAPSQGRTPRWKPRSDMPKVAAAPAVVAPPGPRRAVLSAPPPGSSGPTPLRPTPRFDTKAADAGEKFGSPRPPVAPAPVVSETQPPLGYSPPVTPAVPETPPPEEGAATPVPLPED